MSATCRDMSKVKMCNICLQLEKTKEYDKLDLCNGCMEKVLELVR